MKEKKGSGKSWGGEGKEEKYTKSRQKEILKNQSLSVHERLNPPSMKVNEEAL